MPGIRFTALLAATLVAVIVQLRVLASTGFAPDLALAALLAVASFGAFMELTAAAVLVVLILNWQPFPSAELWWLALLPFCAAFFARRAPFERWATSIVIIVGGLVLFPLLAAPAFIIRSPVAFLWSVLIGTLFGTLVFHGASALGAPDRTRYHTR